MEHLLEVNCAEDLRRSVLNDRRVFEEMNVQRTKVRQLYNQHNRIFNDDGLGFHYSNGRDLYRGAPDLGRDWIVEWLPRLGADKLHDVYFYSPENDKFCSKNEVVWHFQKQGRDMSYIDSVNKSKAWAFDMASRGRILSEVSPRIDRVLIAVGELVCLGHGTHLHRLNMAETHDYFPIKTAVMTLTLEEVRGLTMKRITVQSEFMLLLARLFQNLFFVGGRVESYHVDRCLSLYKDVVARSFSNRDVDSYSSETDHKYLYELGATLLASALRLMKMKSVGK